MCPIKTAATLTAESSASRVEEKMAEISRFTFFTISSFHLCAADNGGGDSCQGDSGGPLFAAENGR